VTLLDADTLRWDRECAAIRSATKGAAAPCVLCGEKGEGHHPNYARPRETIALCRAHHRRLHVRLAQRGRDPRLVYFEWRRSGGPAPFEARRITPAEVRP
jgi:hypothetical protein